MRREKRSPDQFLGRPQRGGVGAGARFAANQGGNSIVYILVAVERLIASAVSRVARRGGYVDIRPEAEKRYHDWLSAD